jgi:hypothetical protein
VVSIYLIGRNLDGLAGRPGQSITWRFLTRRGWWQAHPFCLSAAPNGQYLRITVKASGDHTGELQRLTPGVRVLAEALRGLYRRPADPAPRPPPGRRDRHRPAAAAVRDPPGRAGRPDAAVPHVPSGGRRLLRRTRGDRRAAWCPGAARGGQEWAGGSFGAPPGRRDRAAAGRRPPSRRPCPAPPRHPIPPRRRRLPPRRRRPRRRRRRPPPPRPGRPRRRRRRPGRRRPRRRSRRPRSRPRPHEPAADDDHHGAGGVRSADRRQPGVLRHLRQREPRKRAGAPHVQRHQIVDVVALRTPNSHGRSVQINNRAAPLLRQEVLAAQSDGAMTAARPGQF